VVESAGYTPFEQLQSRGNVGPWSDLYALAATIVKIMTGEAPPKANDRTMGDPWQPLSDREELRGGYSARFLECLDRALCLPIEERWQSADEWKMGLSQGELAPVAKNVAPAITASTTTKKSSGGLISAMAATVMIACGVTWWNLREPAPGALVIMSDPAGAEVVDANGKNLGKSPLELKGLPGGKPWNGQLKLEGYNNEPIRADVPSGDTTMLPLVKLQATTQKVVVTSEPSGAKVIQEGEQVGETPWEGPAIAPGSKVEFVLRKEGYEEQALSGEVKTGESLVLRTELKIIPMQGSKAGEEREFEISKGVKMTFCWCPAGDFVMGSSQAEEGRDSDEDQVKVTLSKGFWMGKTEVTQAQWQAVMGSNPSYFKGDNLPVDSVSWEDTQTFLTKLNALIGSDDGRKMVLPTEAQWEYGCRAGAAGPYSGGTLGQVGWYIDNSGGKTQAVGTKKANAWGLHDMHGNVWEWCQDWYQDELPGGGDPQGAISGSYRVYRGGGLLNYAIGCRAASRNFITPSITSIIFGFRVARSSVP
jgi:formylglycine-generating enzyme required for sulfatase activity